MSLALALAPESSFANSAAVDYFRTRADHSAVPSLLSQDDRAYYRDLFAAIRHEDWVKVQALFAQKPDGPLHAVAQAEYYLDPKSPKIALDALNQWLVANPSLPETTQIGQLAAKRGGATVQLVPPEAQPFITLPASQKRLRPRDTNDGTMPGSVANAIQAKIKADDPLGAKTLLDGADAGLSPPARSEWRAKIAWSFYIENDDANAYALAKTASEGLGPWVAEGLWTAGLAAFRMNDCQGAATSFAQAASLAENIELKSAADYWQARALIRCRQPEKASTPLRSAARRDETFYGMLAAEQLGLSLPTTHSAPDFTQKDWQNLRDLASVRTAVGLSEIGEDALADEVLRWQAHIGDPAQYQPLSRLARDLGLPNTQLWMAYNAPIGGAPEPATRYPTPKWTPANGWKVDPALVYAHTLQESVFRANAVSPAGARGLMQVMPSAAHDRAAELGVSAADVTRPEVNLAFGQSHLEMLRDSAGTQGLLPKVIAAYNAGLAPVTRWNSQVRDHGDPLLWIESLPYWETRGYVNIVLKNYWMYERQAGGESGSRLALAEDMWPSFPGLDGSKPVRMSTYGAIIRGR